MSSTRQGISVTAPPFFRTQQHQTHRTTNTCSFVRCESEHTGAQGCSVPGGDHAGALKELASGRTRAIDLKSRTSSPFTSKARMDGSCHRRRQHGVRRTAYSGAPRATRACGSCNFASCHQRRQGTKSSFRVTYTVAARGTKGGGGWWCTHACMANCFPKCSFPPD